MIEFKLPSLGADMDEGKLLEWKVKPGDAVRKGDVIHGLDAAAKLPGKVFHAGTALRGAEVVTNGGRVLCAVGLGDTVRSAQRQAYALVDAIRWEGVQYRRDIGHRAIARE